MRQLFVTGLYEAQLDDDWLLADLAHSIRSLAEDDEAVTQFGIEYATRQVDELLRQGAPGIHFYTLNKTRSTTQIVKNLGLANP